MILLESTQDGSGTILRDATLQGGFVPVYGQAMATSATGFLATTATSLPYGIYAGKVAQSGAVGQKQDKYVMVRDDQTYLVDVIGTIGLVTVGSVAFCLTADGLNIDATTSTGGHCQILNVDTLRQKARIRFV